MLYICITCFPDSMAFLENRVELSNLWEKGKIQWRYFVPFGGPIRLKNSLEVTCLFWLFPSAYCSSRVAQLKDGASCLRCTGGFVSFCKDYLDYLSGLFIGNTLHARKSASPSAVSSDHVMSQSNKNVTWVVADYLFPYFSKFYSFLRDVGELENSSTQMKSRVP